MTDVQSLHEDNLRKLTSQCQGFAEKTLEEWMGRDNGGEPESEPEEEDRAGLVRDPIDVRLVINRDGTVHGAQLLMAFGGPNIWVNTMDAQVEGYWGSHRVTIPMDLGIAREINSYYDERVTVEIGF